MANDTLTLLQTAIRKKGGSPASISTVAAELCHVVDHWNDLHWNDRNRLTKENKQLRERIEALEKAGGSQ